MDVRVSEVMYKYGSNPVTDFILVNFENGKIYDGMESELKCEMYKNKMNKRFLAAYTDKMLYMGQIGCEEDLQYNFLVLRKKNSDEVRLINLESVSLRPHIKQYNGLVDSSLTGETVTNAELNKQFGSKRTKRNTEQKERMKLDIENIKEQLEQTVAEIETDDSFLNINLPNDNDSAMYKPPINREASLVENVYDLERLIPPNVLAALETELNIISTSDNFDKLDMFPFCKENVRNLKEHISLETNSRRCKIYIYINYLLKFLATPAKNLSRKLILCKTSKDIDSNILDTFSIQSGTNRTRPMSMRDKTMCYILVLALLASNYNLDLEALSKDMKVGIKKLKEMSKILAFSSNGPTSATLKLPLPAPVLPNLKRKQSK